MQIKSAPYIYGILALGSGYGLVSTAANFFIHPKIIPEIPASNTLLPKNLSIQNTNVSAILSRNLFNIAGTIPNEGQLAAGNEVKCAGTPTPSPLPYNVLGILYGGKAQSSIAMLENRNTQEVLILKNGAPLPQKGYISDINADRVWITSTACPEYIELPRAKLPASRVRRGNAQQTASDLAWSEPGFERIGNDTNVTRQWVNDILTNKLASVLNDALATPHLANGRIDGFTISQIEPMSVYDKLGLKDGDTVMSVNGIPLNDASQAIQTLNALRNEGDIDLQVMRNGQLTTFRVNVQQ